MGFDTIDEGALRGATDLVYKDAAADIEKATEVGQILDALDGKNRFTESFLAMLKQSGDKFVAEAAKIESNIRALGDINSWLTQPYEAKKGEQFDPNNPAGFLIPDQVRNLIGNITNTWIPGLRNKVRDILLHRFGGKLAESLIGTLRGDAEAGKTLQLTITDSRRRAYEANEYDRYMGIIHASNSFSDLNIVLKAFIGAEANKKPDTDVNMKKIKQAQQFIEQLAHWVNGEPHSAAKIASDLVFISNSALPGLRDKVIELLVVELGGDKVAEAIHGAGGRETATRIG
jgi:hypothetical protein